MLDDRAGLETPKSARPFGMPLKCPALWRKGPPHWRWSPSFSELLDPLINRHDAAHLVADSLASPHRKQELAVGHSMAADNGGYLPLRQRVANLMSGNLRVKRIRLSVLVVVLRRAARNGSGREG